jgi:DNA-directed RNA polymerase II subunit RPB2
LFANANLELQEFTCLNCAHLDRVYPIYQVHIPYAAKTLIQELMAMHIATRLKFDIKKDKHEL